MTYPLTRNVRPAIVLLLLGASVLLPVMPAGAQAQLAVDPPVARPGDEVRLIGLRGFANNKAVDVHLDAIDGPVLASFPVAQAAFGPGVVTIPADTKVGSHVLIVTQVLDATNAGIRGLPARAAIEVTGPGGVPAVGRPLVQTEPGRRAALETTTEELDVAPLVLVGLGVAAVALLVAAIGTAVARRGTRQAGAKTEPAGA